MELILSSDEKTHLVSIKKTLLFRNKSFVFWKKLSFPETKFSFLETKFSFPETKFRFLETKFLFQETKFSFQETVFRFMKQDFCFMVWISKSKLLLHTYCRWFLYFFYLTCHRQIYLNVFDGLQRRDFEWTKVVWNVV